MCKNQFIDIEDEESVRSNYLPKVKFNNLVQVIEYSCPTESSRKDTDFECSTDNDDLDNLQNIENLNFVNTEVDIKKLKGKSMMERIMEAKLLNNKTEEVKVEPMHHNSIETDFEVKENICSPILSEIRFNTTDTRNIKNELSTNNLTQNSLRTNSFINSKNSYSTSSMTDLRDKKFIGSMLKKGLYKPEKTPPISKVKRSNSRTSTSRSPVARYINTSTYTPSIKKQNNVN